MNMKESCPKIIILYKYHFSILVEVLFFLNKRLIERLHDCILDGTHRFDNLNESHNYWSEYLFSERIIIS